LQKYSIWCHSRAFFGEDLFRAVQEIAAAEIASPSARNDSFLGSARKDKLRIDGGFVNIWTRWVLSGII
jgi:hypothetical protein